MLLRRNDSTCIIFHSLSLSLCLFVWRILLTLCSLERTFSWTNFCLSFFYSIHISEGVLKRNMISSKLFSFCRWWSLLRVSLFIFTLFSWFFFQLFFFGRLKCFEGENVNFRLLTMHITFMFVLDKSIATRLSCVNIVNKNNFFYWPIHFKLTTQFWLRCVIVL